MGLRMYDNYHHRHREERGQENTLDISTADSRMIANGCVSNGRQVQQTVSEGKVEKDLCKKRKGRTDTSAGRSEKKKVENKDEERRE